MDLNRISKAWVVFHVGGDGQLTAGLHTCDQERLQHCARAIDGGGVACRTGSYDQEFGVLNSHFLRTFKFVRAWIVPVQC